MSDLETALSPRAASVPARVWYVFLTGFSVFGILIADARFFVPGDAGATAAAIRAGDFMYRLGIASGLAGQTCQLFLGLALFRLFRPVNEGRARTLLALVIAMVPVAFLNMLGKFAPLVLFGDAEYSSSFGPAQLEALAFLFLELQKLGTLVAGVFWGLWLVPLGLLVIESRFFPRFLGYLLLAGCAGYLLESFTTFVAPAAHGAVSPFALALSAGGELPFALWMILVGARGPKRESTNG